jgi:hypothetical protein
VPRLYSGELSEKDPFIIGGRLRLRGDGSR